MDGNVPLDEVDTLLNTCASFPEDDDEPPGLVPDDEKDEVFMPRLQGRRSIAGRTQARASAA